MATDVQKQRKPKAQSSPVKTVYLVLYNSVSAVLWATVLGYALVVPPYKGHAFVYPVANDFLRWTQTVAILEILHSALGIVRAPLLTTLMQVWSRLVIVWLPAYLFPSIGKSPFYTTLLLAWALTETVRYTYFAILLSTGRVSSVLVWLRYNMFLVLYPLGSASEMVLMWLAARGPAKGSALEVPLYVLLMQYPIGFPILFGHMLKQRRKIMKAGNDDKTQ